MKVIIDEKLADIPQWVYWTSLDGNERSLLDSIYLEKGQKEFVFQKYFEKKNDSFFKGYLIFSKKGPEKVHLFLQQGYNVTVYIDENTKGVFPYTTGTVINTEWYNHKMKLYRVQDSLVAYNDSLVFAKDKEDSERFSKKVKELQFYIHKGRFLDVLEHTKSPVYATIELGVIKRKMVFSKKTIDSLAKVMKARFPNYKELQMFPEKIQFPPQSENSKRIGNRFHKMFERRFEEKRSGKKKKVEISREFQDSLKMIKAYKMGDKVSNIGLRGLNGKSVNLKDISTEYVLIDFWASWCIPCRKETPYLRKAVEAYPNELTVFAVSFCNSKKEWENTIEKDNSTMFTHGYSGNFLNTKESLLLRKQFGVTAIPANFLLDKNRRIIAMNLRKEDLLHKMNTLYQK